MELLDQYHALEKQIFKYFGYVEDWCVFPIEDSREYYWCPIDSHTVRFDKKKPGPGEEMDYSHEILGNRHLPQSIYEGKDFTMILVDTQCDGNQFLQIFDNAKRVEIKDDDY